MNLQLLHKAFSHFMQKARWFYHAVPIAEGGVF